MTIINKPQGDVVIFDNIGPESAAMILALYSRDPQSVRIHLEKVAAVGPEKFMRQYYVGYGHKSIGDCGSTTICTEYVSMLAAKAIQHNPLYNGQEASTRYLDMTTMPVLNPLGTTSGENIQKKWMSLYSRALSELVPYLTEKYPRLESDKPMVYEKAIKARAFDIARSFLPAGCTTFVGWHTNLRQAWDHIQELLFHPLPEVRSVAETMLVGLQEKYSSSFGFKTYTEQDEYYRMCAKSVYFDYHDLHIQLTFASHGRMYVARMSREEGKILETRPARTELPDWFNRFGQIQFKFLLDFGSFRDIQRHRSATQMMPLLTTSYGFNQWYLTSLSEKLRQEALDIMVEQEVEIAKIDDQIIRQYYIAMGYNVACELTGGLPSIVYIAELRSGQAVHPTLRPIAQKMGRVLKKVFPEMALYCDNSPDEWSTIRGKHDIVKKE